MKPSKIIIFALFVLAVGCNIQADKTGQPVNKFVKITPLSCPEIHPVLEPMPSFVEWVFPTDSIKKDDYDESIWFVDPSLQNAGGIQTTIYASGVDHSVAQSRDSGRGSRLSKRVVLLVNGQVIDEDPVEIMDGLMPDGPFYFKWVITLNQGYYEVTLIFDIDTGETIEYSWNFCIVP